MRSTRRDERAAFPFHLRFALCAFATTWAALVSWRGFTENPAQYLFMLIAIGLVVAVTGAVARWRRLPGVAVVASQLVVGGAVTCQIVAGRPYPGGEFWATLGRATDAANTYAAPVPWTDAISVQPLLVVGGFVSILTVDLAAATIRRVPLAGLPLLTVYSVPISLIDRGLSWWVFAATAFGFLFLLYLQEEEHLSRWGRSLDGSSAPVRRLSDSVRASAVGVGAIATAAAVTIPVLVPTFSFSVFDVGPGRGGDDDIEVVNPLVDLRQDLVRGPDIDLITIRTDDPSPDHLRISVLNRFTDNEWSNGDRDVPTSNLAQSGALPPLEGVDPSFVTFDDASYDIEIDDAFKSTWLPTQAPISDIAAAGDWRFDASTMDFIASDDDLTTAGIDYRMTAALPDYDSGRLLRLNTRPGDVDEELTELPSDMPSIVADEARKATIDATSDFEAAVLLNQYFRDSGLFTYDLPNSPDDAVGTGELADFLDPEGDRTGYCEQFSAAMAVMARTLGIPARVAVGFLAPDRVDGTSDEWVYSAHDLHAWVELYFPRAGWVLFDPTPDDRVLSGALPDYADAEINPIDIPTGPTEAETTAPQTQEPRPEPSSIPAQPQTPETVAEEPTVAEDPFPWVTVVLVVLGVALLVALVLLPRTVRARRRERRLAGGAESAWEELRATAVDLRLTWPDGRSPRETAARVAGWFGREGDRDPRPARGPEQDPAAVEALDRIARHVERLRYARHHAVEPGSLRADVEACCVALVAGAPPRTRRRAQWFPRSAFQRGRVVEATPTRDDAELVGASSEVL